MRNPNYRIVGVTQLLEANDAEMTAPSFFFVCRQKRFGAVVDVDDGGRCMPRVARMVGPSASLTLLPCYTDVVSEYDNRQVPFKAIAFLHRDYCRPSPTHCIGVESKCANRKKVFSNDLTLAGSAAPPIKRAPSRRQRPRLSVDLMCIFPAESRAVAALAVLPRLASPTGHAGFSMVSLTMGKGHGGSLTGPPWRPSSCSDSSSILRSRSAWPGRACQRQDLHRNDCLCFRYCRSRGTGTPTCSTRSLSRCGTELRTAVAREHLQSSEQLCAATSTAVRSRQLRYFRPVTDGMIIAEDKLITDKSSDSDKVTGKSCGRSLFRRASTNMFNVAFPLGKSLIVVVAWVAFGL
ncbi:hypothetical protein CCUS01_06529 [Colletotrichum cuscutae]|uniref:Uncharacterized protein n=1 Tax=Colletotrichum cuscutae TaxID=1209917 RepID=A0AAI9V3W6_9PEZI|nr:hypothetical protein CCUS01_06529 [Colletotrichum cuscutae]